MILSACRNCRSADVFSIICIISIALIAAALIVCRFMFSSPEPRASGGVASSFPRLDAVRGATWKLLLNYLLCSRYEDVRDDASARQSPREKNTALTMKLTCSLVITLVGALMMRPDDRELSWTFCHRFLRILEPEQW